MNREKKKRSQTVSTTERDRDEIKRKRIKSVTTTAPASQELEEFSLIFTYRARSMHSAILYLFDGSCSIRFCFLFYICVSLSVCLSLSLDSVFFSSILIFEQCEYRISGIVCASNSNVFPACGTHNDAHINEHMSSK